MSYAVLRGLDAELRQWQIIETDSASQQRVECVDVEQLPTRLDANLQLDVLLPAALCFSSRISLPGNLRGQQRLTALQYALEEEIAGDGEAQHLIFWQNQGSYQCVVVSHKVMQQLQEILRTLAARILRVLPLQALVPITSTENSGELLVDAQNIIVTLPEQHFVSCSLGQWPRFAELLQQQLPEQNWQATAMLEAAIELPDSVINPEWQAALNLPQQVQQVAPHWNLLQREYSPSSKWQQLIKQSVWSAVGLLLLGGFWLGSLWLDNQQGQRQLDTLLQLQQQLIAEVAPAAVPVAKPRQWVEQRLQGASSGVQQSEFVRLYQEFLRVIQSLPEYQVQNVQFQNQQLSVNLLMPDVLSFEKLRNAAASGFSASLEAINRSDAGVQGRLVLKEAR